jgi:sugar/nucleoside kinase (ribokinase family)
MYFIIKLLFLIILMMKIAVASHLVLDSIQDVEGRITRSLGGPACYCALTARQFRFEVILATKVGKDFFSKLNANTLRDHGIAIKDYQISHEFPTTEFEIILNKDSSRELFLLSKCAPLTVDDIQKIQTDCWLVSPVIDEVPANVLAAIIKNGGKRNFIMFDPQGYLRSLSYPSPQLQQPFSSFRTPISLVDNLPLDLSGISAIKVDKEELAALTGGIEGLVGMQFLQATKGVEFVISTTHNAIHLLHNNVHYWIGIDVDTFDYTGAGDILSAAFCCSYIKEKDPLWAICFGAGAVRAALETKLTGLNKIPSKSKIEENASYYYGTIAFQKL